MSLTSLASMGQYLTHTYVAEIPPPAAVITLSSATTNVKHDLLYVQPYAYLILYSTNDSNASITVKISGGNYTNSEYLCVAGGGGASEPTGQIIHGSTGGDVNAGSITLSGTYNISIAGRANYNNNGDKSFIKNPNTNLIIESTGGDVGDGQSGSLNGNPPNLPSDSDYTGGQGVDITNVAPHIASNIYTHWSGGGGSGNFENGSSAVIGKGGIGGGGGGRGGKNTTTAAFGIGKQGAGGWPVITSENTLESVQGLPRSGGGAGAAGSIVSKGGSGIVVLAINSSMGVVIA